MAETLFTDIINNLGKAKKEGKISGGYRYKDGKLNIGGGYYGDDSMFEIDVNKDGGNILFKKRFADGGSTNGSGDKAFTAKVKELMDDGYEFGEAVKEAMRQGYKNGDKVTPISQINAPQRAYQSVVRQGIESTIKELFAKGLGAENITKRLKLLYPDKTINKTLIGNYLTYAKRNLGLVKPGLDVAIQNQYGPMRSLTEVQKAIDEAPKIKKGDKYYDMNSRDLEGRSVWNNIDPNESRTGKKGKQYVTRSEMLRYNPTGKKPKLNIKGPSKVIIVESAKTKSNQERYKKDKLAKLNAGAETVALNKELSTKYVTEANNKLRQDFKNNPSETISKLRNNKNIMFQLETSFDSQSGEFKSEKVTNKKIKNLIKAGMFSIEHTSPMAKGAKNTNFTTNLSLITNRANAKIMRPLDTFMNSNKYKDFSDIRVVKIKDFLDKNNLRVKIRGMDGYFGGDNKLTARERLAKQGEGFRLNSAAAAVEDGVKGIYSNVKDAVSNITDVDYSKMQLGKGNVAKFAGIAKNAAKVAAKALGVAALPLEAYFMKQMYNEGKTPAEILASPFFLSNMVGEAQDLLKMEPVERQAIKNEQIAEDFSMMDSDFYTPPLKGVEAVNTQMVKDRVAQERALEEEKRKNLRNKTLPNEGLLRILSNPTYEGVL